MLFDGLNLLLFIDATAVGADSITTNAIFIPVSALNTWQPILLLAIFERTVITEAHFKFLNFAVQVIDDIFILADMQSYQLLVCNGLSLNVLGSVGVLQCVYRLLELTARWTHIDDHHSFAVTA